MTLRERYYFKFYKTIIFNKVTLYLLLCFLLLSCFSFCQETKDYKFNWYPTIEIKDDIIKLPDSSKYETYNTKGVWEDNLGNYGMMKCIVSQFTNNELKITLDGYCEAIDHNKIKFWLYINRKSYNLAGVGDAKYLFTDIKYKTLLNKTCLYAAQILEGGGVFKLVCKLSVEEYKILGNNQK